MGVSVGLFSILFPGPQSLVWIRGTDLRLDRFVPPRSPIVLSLLCLRCGVSSPVVDAMVSASALRFRRKKSQMSAAAIKHIINPTPTKRPATFPGCDMNPASLVCADPDAVGGAVGVIVIVLTWPVTVITDTIGVGVHVDIGEVLVFAVSLGDVNEVDKVDVEEGRLNVVVSVTGTGT